MSSIAMTTEAIHSQAASIEATRPFFSVRDMHAYYGESYIVQGVSLDIRKGEILVEQGDGTIPFFDLVCSSDSERVEDRVCIEWGRI